MGLVECPSAECFSGSSPNEPITLALFPLEKISRSCQGDPAHPSVTMSGLFLHPQLITVPLPFILGFQIYTINGCIISDQYLGRVLESGCCSSHEIEGS